MGRFKPELLVRVRQFGSRIIDLADELSKQRRSFRVIDQLVGAGTSVGANTYEADEAMSRADFCKTLAIVIKELNETKFWLQLIADRAWVKPTRLEPLETEAAELKRIFGAMLTRTRRRA